jgi:hypothetical protein
MLAWIVLIWLLIVGFGSFLEWSAKSRFGAFIFFSVLGTIVSGIFLMLGAAMIEATLNLFESGISGNFLENTWPTVWLTLSLLSGTVWAFVRVHGKECRRQFRQRTKCEHCGGVDQTSTFDYCAQCGKALCEECFDTGCCGHVPAKSGLETEVEESIRRIDKMTGHREK